MYEGKNSFIVQCKFYYESLCYSPLNKIRYSYLQLHISPDMYIFFSFTKILTWYFLTMKLQSFVAEANTFNTLSKKS